MLNYTVPPFQFLVGGFDASDYLDSIALSVPMHEIRQALLWSGRFTISNNLVARTRGLTDADFSEAANPGRWRPYQAIVRLNIRGFQSPVFRIDNYRYNQQTLTGEGTLTQIPTAVAGDRPGVRIETTVSGSIDMAISKLLVGAFVGATIQPQLSIHNDGGVLDVPLTTRNPWADAVRLTGLSWHWLTVDVNESIRSVSGVSSQQIFSRTLAQVELVPDLAAIYQSAQEVIVTGARQVEDKDANKPDPAKKTPSVPRPKFKTTTENRPIGTVFNSLGNSTTPIVFEEKTIIYQYWDDPSWSQYVPNIGALTAFLYDIQSQTQTGIKPSGKPPDLNTPLQTITIKRQPIGWLFPSAGTVTTLTEAEVIIESNLRKLILKPAGVLFRGLGGVETGLALEKREDLTSAVIPPGAQLTPVKTDLDGKTQAYEARPILESPQPQATRPLKTEALKGHFKLQMLTWTPVLAKPVVVDFGFLPDQGHADDLAHKIGVREQQRRDQVLVDMPIPDEWLGAGWPLLGLAAISGSTYRMDGCAISITDREARFGFTGGLVSGYGAVSGATGVAPPQYQILMDLISELAYEAEFNSAVATDLAPEIGYELLMGSGIPVDLIPELAYELLIATGSGILLAPELAYEASIDTGTGILLAPELAYEASIDTGTGILLAPELAYEASIATGTGVLLAPELAYEASIAIGAGVLLAPELAYELMIVTPAIQSVSIAVSPTSILEGATATFTITRNSTSELPNPLTVNLTVAGTAGFGTDYTVAGAASFAATTASVVIPGGQLSKSITCVATPDLVPEVSETIILTPIAVPGLVSVGAGATLTIAPVPSTVLLHFAAFADSATPANTITAGSGATISSAASKFGGTSMLCTGSATSYASIADSAAIEFGSADFTIESWLNQSGVNFADLLAKGTGTPAGSSVKWNIGNNCEFYVGSTTHALSTPVSALTGTFVHLAIVRNGSTLQYYVGGTLVTSASISGSINNVTQPLRAGYFNSVGSGFIDEFRLSIGTAIYNGNFTPPTAAYIN